MTKQKYTQNSILPHLALFGRDGRVGVRVGDAKRAAAVAAAAVAAAEVLAEAVEPPVEQLLREPDVVVALAAPSDAFRFDGGLGLLDAARLPSAEEEVRAASAASLITASIARYRCEQKTKQKRNEGRDSKKKKRCACYTRWHDAGNSSRLFK